MTEDERAIREVIATWLKASEAGDTEKVLSLMADDVVFLVAGQKPFGKKEFAERQGGLARYSMKASAEVREVKTSGDWAFAWADLSVTMIPLDGGPPVRRHGNTLSIFERLADGRWVISRDANLLVADP